MTHKLDGAMLWFDNDRKATLEEKVRRAAEYFKERQGYAPDLMYVHSDALPDGKIKVDGITVEPSASVIADHFEVGHTKIPTRRK